MNEFVEIEVDYRTVHLAAHPVTLPDFVQFLHDAGRPVPPGVQRGPANPQGGGQAVIGVSQIDAAAYCEWIGKRIGHACRLPSTEELDALMPEKTVTQRDAEVPDAGFWPHEEGRIPEMRSGLRPVFLCEWTREVEEAGSERDPERLMARVFYPPWLREGSNPLHAHAALLASESFSFVTFRVSYEGYGCVS